MKLAIDSSCFAKSYVQEIGSDKLDRLLESASETKDDKPTCEPLPVSRPELAYRPFELQPSG